VTAAILIALCPLAVNGAALARIADRYMADVPADVAIAILREESTCRRGLVSRMGAVGPWQVKPDGQALYRCPPWMRRRLAVPSVNAQCAARIIRFLKTKCGPDPLNWLSMFHGTRSCRPTAYSRRVMRRLSKIGRSDAD
jgi:hypothetical protein